MLANRSKPVDRPTQARRFLDTPSITREVMAPPRRDVYRDFGETEMSAAGPAQRQVGELLRHWRRKRRLSQLELATRTETSTRHLSFVETGRAQPSREMILRLCEHLSVSLRERNHVLLTGGFAPVYSETSLESPHMSAVLGAVRQVLAGHEPYPAVVVDRAWNLVEANTGFALFSEELPPNLLAEPVNVLRAGLHPEGLARRIINLGEWRAHLLNRLHRQVVLTAEPELKTLYDELRAYPCQQAEPEVELPGAGDVFVPLRITHGGGEIAFLSTVTTFGTPVDITVAELTIESFFPADAYTASVLSQRRNSAVDANANRDQEV